MFFTFRHPGIFFSQVSGGHLGEKCCYESWKNLRPWARESVATTASDWLTASRSPAIVLIHAHEGRKTSPLSPLRRRAVTGLTVIWGDVLSADFQIHKSLRSDEIEAAWKARRGDWHVWVALWVRRCKLHANVPSCICQYVLSVRVWVHNLYALCFVLPTYACICMRVESPLVHTQTHCREISVLTG